MEAASNGALKANQPLLKAYPTVKVVALTLKTLFAHLQFGKSSVDERKCNITVKGAARADGGQGHSLGFRPWRLWMD
ncbi:MAG: hypothetical protein ACP5JW_05700 [Candidatus Bathyarchaeia archaeon]